MARYSIEDTTLTALGDAIRNKKGELPLVEAIVAGKTNFIPMTEGQRYKFSILLTKITNTSGESVDAATLNIKAFSVFLNDINENTRWSFEVGKTTEIIYYMSEKSSFGSTFIFRIGFTEVDVEGTVSIEMIDENNKFIYSYTPLQMAEEINNLQPAPLESAFTITNDCSYRFSNSGWDWFIQQYGDKIITKDITNADYMFRYFNLNEIPFDLNFKASAGGYNDIAYIFYGCANLKSIPKLNGLRPNNTQNMFNSCTDLRELDYESVKDIDWSYIEGLTSAYGGDRSNIFANCYSLRSFPMEFLNHTNPFIYYAYATYNGLFNNCYVLDKVENLPVIPASWSGNAFSNAFNNCHRLSRLTFASYEGSVNWSKQTIDLTTCGYISSSSIYYILGHNSGITADKEINGSITYDKLKNDPDRFATTASYSLYGAHQAIHTLNSLPTTTGSGCTIKFKSGVGAGSGYANSMATIPEEVIAAAADKGWTVTFA